MEGSGAVDSDPAATPGIAQEANPVEAGNAHTDIRKVEATSDTSSSDWVAFLQQIIGGVGSNDGAGNTRRSANASSMDEDQIRFLRQRLDETEVRLRHAEGITVGSIPVRDIPLVGGLLSNSLRPELVYERDSQIQLLCAHIRALQAEDQRHRAERAEMQQALREDAAVLTALARDSPQAFSQACQEALAAKNVKRQDVGGEKGGNTRLDNLGTRAALEEQARIAEVALQGAQERVQTLCLELADAKRKVEGLEEAARLERQRRHHESSTTGQMLQTKVLEEMKATMTFQEYIGNAAF